MTPGALLDALNFVLAGAREGFGPFVAVYLQAQNFDPATTGVVMSLAGVGGLLFTTPIGHWVDRSMRKRELLILAVAVIAVGAVVIVLTKDVRLIGVAQMLIGIGDTALAPLIAAMTLGIVGLDAFASRMSRNEAWNNAGSASRSALAAMLGYFFGLQYVAVTILVSSLLSALVVTRIKATHIDDVVARSGETSDEPAWRALVRMSARSLSRCDSASCADRSDSNASETSSGSSVGRPGARVLQAPLAATRAAARSASTRLATARSCVASATVFSTCRSSADRARDGRADGATLHQRATARRNRAGESGGAVSGRQTAH